MYFKLKNSKNSDMFLVVTDRGMRLKKIAETNAKVNNCSHFT